MMKCQRMVLQNLSEIDWLMRAFRSEGVKSYLEIGSKHGGSLWRVANYLPKGSRIVSVDLPHGDGSFKETQASLEQCVGALVEKGYDAYLILGDSTNRDVVEQVKALGPFDACFIDANHTMPFIKKDWQNYGSISKLVAFHDIAWKRAADWQGVKMDVAEFWNDIKFSYRYQEIMLDGKDNGIGVLWRNETGGNS